jgi:hypothetical protein
MHIDRLSLLVVSSPPMFASLSASSGAIALAIGGGSPAARAVRAAGAQVSVAPPPRA